MYSSNDANQEWHTWPRTVIGGRFLPPVIGISWFLSLDVFQLMAIKAQDTSKAALALDMGCHSIYIPSIHGQTPSMHLCLNVDEILRLIAHELVASRGKGTTVGLACCCKGFEDPVLDGL